MFENDGKNTLQILHARYDLDSVFPDTSLNRFF